MRILLTNLLALSLLVASHGCNSSDPGDNQSNDTSSQSDSKSSNQPEIKEQLSTVGMGFLNHEQIHRRFPSAVGNGSVDGNTGLSWRVHLLFHTDRELLKEFKLDEPWDSPHNKKLIEKMPDIYKTPGVSEPGKTSMHVFTGEGTPFDGEKGTKSSRIGGSRNTFLVVVAGADTADYWTKPGGLEFNAEDPVKSLGNIEKDFWVLFPSSLVKKIKKDLKPETFRSLIHVNPSEKIDEPIYSE